MAPPTHTQTHKKNCVRKMPNEEIKKKREKNTTLRKKKAIYIYIHKHKIAYLKIETE